MNALVRSQILTTAPETTEPGRLLTMAAAAQRAGIGYKTLTSYVARRQWPEPDEVRDGVKLWRQATVDKWIATRKRRNAR